MLKPKKKRRRRPKPRLDCPFCQARLPDARQFDDVYSGGGALGGRCSCGAVFIVDDTGRLGGMALLDAQALLCEGDLNRALALQADRDFELRNRPVRPVGANPFERPRGPAYGEPQLWVLRATQERCGGRD